MSAFFETPLEPCLKAPFMRRSSGGAENDTVFLRSPSNRVVSRRAARVGLSTALAVALTVGWAALASPSAWAGRKDDHDKARAAVQAGEVLPLPALLERLQRTHPGKVLELELEFEDDVDDVRAAGRKAGRWVYEVKLLQADGQLLKLEVDGATAQVLKVKRESDRKRRREHPPLPRAKDDSR